MSGARADQAGQGEQAGQASGHDLSEWSFGLHAALAVVALAALNWLVARRVPFEIAGIGNSYLIFFYHFPAAINVFVFYAGVLAAGLFYLSTGDPAWDRRARVAAEVGVLANAVLLVTGSTWARAAWGVWWVWDDPRLISAAVMSLSYLGYLSMQYGLEDPVRRRRYCAVYGVLAFLNVPIVHYAIRWFGAASHPLQVESSPAIAGTRWYGVLAFFLFYSLLYRWKVAREDLHESVESCLDGARQLEENRR